MLRPFTAAVTSTGADAIAPTLRALVDDFNAALARAQSEAQDHLDKILSEGDRKPIVPLDLNIRNRHLATEADVEALLAEIREKLLAQVRAGTRIRLA